LKTRILVTVSCVYEGSVWPEGWEGEAPVEVAEALISKEKARLVWVSEHLPSSPSLTRGNVERAVGKRERG